MVIDPFFGTSGPRNARIVIVGEAWGREEAQVQRPFVGQSGRELFRMLGEALQLELPLLRSALEQRSTAAWLSVREQWLQKTGILLCNVMPAQPPANDFTHFLYPNSEAKRMKLNDWNGVYPRPQLLAGIDHLHRLLSIVRPAIVVAAGNWALHILTPHANTGTKKGYKLPAGITNWRGSQTYLDAERLGSTGKPQQSLPPAPVLTSTPLLPIIHPATILREWEYRHVTVHDLRSRLGRFLSGALAWEAPSYNDIWRPTLGDVRRAFQTWRDKLDSGAEVWLSVDLETYARRYISCAGICDGDLALCIPKFYFDSAGRYQPYWQPDEEIEIWLELKYILEHPNARLIGQNFIYDTQYFARYCIDAIVSGETMVGHHLLFPGTPKDLATLASLYNHHYCYWKDESEEWAADELSAEDLWKYNCQDIRRTYEAWFVIWSAIQHQDLTSLYTERLDQWRLSREMTLRGVHQDRALRQRFLTQLYHELTPVEEWLLYAIPEGWRYTAEGRPWFTSSQATAKLLYEAVGLTPVLQKKTRQPTTDDSAINILCERRDAEWLSPLLLRLRDYRSAKVFQRNFLEVKDGPSGRLYGQFNIATPETFRWSATKNAFEEGCTLQNMPKIED